MRIVKKILIGILIIVAMVLMSITPSEPEGEVSPFMSDIVYIPSKVYARGKAKVIKKKTLKSDYELLGEFRLTGYCNCARCCGKAGQKTASGTTPKSNHTVAADKGIPFGTELVIDGIKYTVEDRGGAIKGNRIDVYFDSHSETLDFGVKTMKVYKKKPPKLISKLKVIKGSVIKFADKFRG